MSNGKIYLIPTEISPATGSSILNEQVRNVITSLDYYLVEDLRTARRYISSLRLGLTIEELSFHLLDKKTSEQELDSLIKPVFLGRNIGIMSEAGCPGVADPGSIAVKYAHKKNIDVVPLVGPSSLVLALMSSGLNGQSFAFQGYLPINKADLGKKIRKVEETSSLVNQTQIFIETPYRNQALLDSLLKHCNDETLLCIAVDITGEGEMIKTKTIREWKKENIDIHKKPTVFLLQALFKKNNLR